MNCIPTTKKLTRIKEHDKLNRLLHFIKIVVYSIVC